MILMRGWACLLFCCAALLGQSDTGELRLKVMDQAGLPVPSSVELVSQAIKFLQPIMKEANIPEQTQELVMKFFKNLGGAPVVIAVTILKNPDPHMKMTLIQSGAALMQNLLLAATAEGLGTCWMTGANYLEDEILKFLGKTDQELLGLTPIGYPAKEPPAPPRKPREIRWLGFE
jgi:nitroreductase